MKYRRYILGWLLLLPLNVVAQTPAVEPGAATPAATPEAEKKTNTSAPAKPVEPEMQIEVGGSFEQLSRGDTWQSYFVNFSRRFRSARTLYGSACVVRRFGLTDPCLMIGLYQPLNKSRRWAATFEASGSPHHQVLPVYSFFGQIERNFGKGWLGHAGLRHSHYSADDVILGKATNTVNLGTFGVERYFKAYRAAYNLYVAHLNGRGTSASHVFQGNYYYDERNSIGLGFAFGEEIESVGEGRLIRTKVQEVSLTGRQWMNQKWGFSYVALWHRQGRLYTRSGVQIGVLLRF